MNEFHAGPRRIQDPSGDLPGPPRWSGPLADGGVGTRASFLRKDFDLAEPSGGRDPADQRARALSRLHQRQARRRRPADARLDQLRQAARATRPTTSATCCRPGDNTIDIWLGDGWYRSQMMWPANAIFNCWGDEIGAHRRARARGERGCCSRPTRRWQSGLLPILKSGIYFGEIYDARLEGAAGRPAAPRSLAFDTSAAGRRTRPSRCASSTPFAGRQILERRRGPHDLRLRPERRRLCRLHRRGRARRARHRRACRDPRPRRPVRQRATMRIGGGARRVRAARAAAPRAIGRIFTFQGFRYARVTIEGKAEIVVDRARPDQLGDRRRPASFASGASAGQPAGREHHLVAALATSSRCRPTARSATSGSAGPATRRSSPRPPATCTTATTSCANGCAT